MNLPTAIAVLGVLIFVAVLARSLIRDRKKSSACAACAARTGCAFCRFNVKK